jgi:hypothetical protein
MTPEWDSRQILVMLAIGLPLWAILALAGASAPVAVFTAIGGGLVGSVVLKLLHRRHQDPRLRAQREAPVQLRPEERPRAIAVGVTLLSVGAAVGASVGQLERGLVMGLFLTPGVVALSLRMFPLRQSHKNQRIPLRGRTVRRKSTSRRHRH